MKTILTILFALLYSAVGFVSVYHATTFFGITNAPWLAWTLSIAFEIGQAAVLFSLLSGRSKRKMSWVLMITLTLVQIFGNIYSSYKFAFINNLDNVQYFMDSVLFFLSGENAADNAVIISYITGAILPIVTLCITSLIIDINDLKREGESQKEDKIIL